MSSKRYLEALAKNEGRDGRVKPPTDKHRQVARDFLRKDKPISVALARAGYSPQQSAKGMALVRHIHALATAFREETALIEKEKAAGPLVPDNWHSREKLVIDRLVKNVRRGEDKAVQSCKLLGSHKELACWTVESVTGNIIINVPPAGFLQPIMPIPEDPE